MQPLSELKSNSQISSNFGQNADKQIRNPTEKSQ